MADQYLQQLTADTDPAVDDVLPIANSTTGNLQKITYAGIGGLVPNAVTASVSPAVVGNLYVVDSTSGAVTVTLPVAANKGERVGVLWTAGANTVTLAPGASDEINDAASSIDLDEAGHLIIVQALGDDTGWYTDSRYGGGGAAATSDASIVRAPFGGATLSMTSDKTAQNYSTGVALSWDQAVFDSHSFWSSGSPTRLTIPAGVKKVRLNAGFRAELVAADSIVSISFKKNGANFTEGKAGQYSGDTSSTDLIHAVSAVTGILEVVEGDYFEAIAYVNDTSITVEYDGGTTFSIEVVEWEQSYSGNYRMLAPTFGGVALSWTSNKTTFDADPAVAATWDQADYDTHGFWTSGSATRITVPAGVKKMSFAGSLYADNLTADSVFRYYIKKNGSDFTQQFIQDSGDTTTNHGISFATGAIEVTEGDYFEAFIYCTDTSITLYYNVAGNFFGKVEEWETSYTGVYSLGLTPKFGGAHLTLSADVTGINATTGYTVLWTAESYDTHAFHDLVTNTNRLTVPAGVSKVRVSTLLGIDNLVADDYRLLIIDHYNSSDVSQSAWTVDTESGRATSLNGVHSTTPILTVAEGDYFQVRLYTGSDTSIDLSSGECYFQIEVVEWESDYDRMYNLALQPPFGGALAKLTADDTGVNAGSGHKISWDATEYDSDTFYAGGAPTRLTIPAGVAKVRLTANVSLSSVTANNYGYCQIWKNNAAVLGGSQSVYESGATNLGFSVTSGILAVAENDYFEVRLVLEDTSVTIDSSVTSFTIEVVEWDTTSLPTSKAVLAAKAESGTAAVTGDTGVLYLVETTSGVATVTINLPSPAVASDRIGIKYAIENTGTDTVVIHPAASDTIDGSGTDITLTATGDYRELVSAGDGTNWYLVASV